MTVRPDLIQKRVWMGRQSTWVIKDPISGEFFYFGEREYRIISLSDQRSVAETLHACHQNPGLATLTESELRRFLNDAVRKRILTVQGVPMADTSARSLRKRRSWQQLLAMRLPGIQPTRMLDRLIPLAAPFVSVPALALSCVFALLALITIGVHFESFANDIVQSASQLRSPSYWLVLMSVIAFAKIIHELSHAMVCRRLGGEVREMGVMLLVGIPCLYCDVSDAWLFERRWKRIAVSAAGIWAEVTLASLAALTWAWTVDGPIQDICVTLVLVCSVSTVFINANPLLRYDGYYILSDFLGIPNLAPLSKSFLRSMVQRWIWGNQDATVAPPVAIGWSRHHLNSVLFTYGILSSAYRLFVLTLILWWFYLAADSVGLGAPVGIVVLAVVISSAFRLLMEFIRPPRRSVDNGQPWFRAGFRGVCLATILVTVLLVPLPRHITSSMTVISKDGHELYVTTPGKVIQQIENGSTVRQGDTIIVLYNPDIESRLTEYESRCETLKTKLDVLQNQRGFGDPVSQAIPTMEKSLADAERQFELLKEESTRLILKAPQDGVVFAPARRHRISDDDRVAQPWLGTPLDSINAGCWLDQGTIIGIVGDPVRREAILSVSQEQIELLRVGQSVSAMLGSAPRDSITGKITEVASSPVVELSNENPISTDTTNYQVRVQLDDAAMILPVHLKTKAKITVDRVSLLKRIGRFIAGAFETTQLADGTTDSFVPR